MKNAHPTPRPLCDSLCPVAVGEAICRRLHVIGVHPLPVLGRCNAQRLRASRRFKRAFPWYPERLRRRHAGVKPCPELYTTERSYFVWFVLYTAALRSAAAATTAAAMAGARVGIITAAVCVVHEKVSVRAQVSVFCYKSRQGPRVGNLSLHRGVDYI